MKTIKKANVDWKQYVGKIVQFNDFASQCGSDFDKGMKALVVGIEYLPPTNPANTIDVIIYFDFSEFAEYNKQFSFPDFYGPNGTEGLSWHETIYYPKDFKVEEKVYLNSNPYFDVVKS